MSLSRKTTEELLGIAEMAFNVAKTDEKFKAPLLAYRIDDARVDEYLAIFSDAKEKYHDFVRERGEQFEATAAVEKALAEAKPVYNEHVTLARLALKENPSMKGKFGLNGRRKRRVFSWIGQAEVFYRNLLDDAEMLASLDARYGLTLERLEAGRDLVLAVKAVNSKQESEKSESQQARVDKDESLRLLQGALSEYFQVCKFAHADNPQLLERVGITVLSENYTRKVKKVAPATEEPEVTGETGGTTPAE